MNSNKLKQILNLSRQFAENDENILALGLCGSWARGNPNPDSDIDLSIISKNKEHFRKSNWLKFFGLEKIGEQLNYFEDKNYGLVWSRHVYLQSKIKIEFSFADLSWADTDKLDKGTAKVISDGYEIIYDPNKILEKLVACVNSAK